MGVLTQDTEPRKEGKERDRDSANMSRTHLAPPGDGGALHLAGAGVGVVSCSWKLGLHCVLKSHLIVLINKSLFCEGQPE